MEFTEKTEFYQCFNRGSNGVIAADDTGIYILKGSRLALSDTCSYEKTERTNNLLKNGIIAQNIFIKDCPIKSLTVGVSIVGRHGVSKEAAEKKLRIINREDAERILFNNVSEQETVDSAVGMSTDTNKEDFKKNDSDEVKEGLSIGEIEGIITDQVFQNLRIQNSKINIFSIVGQTHTEHWHSSFFSWLLSPQRGIGLGVFPLERLLYLYISKKKNAPISYEDIDNLQLDQMEFMTEKGFSNLGYHGWNGGSIDVYGESEELIICIENKVTAKEEVRTDGIGQTHLYQDYIEKIKDKSQKAIYLFLTPDPSQMPRCEEFVQITYQEVYDYIILKCLRNPGLEDESRYVLEQYSGNLKNPYKKDQKKYPMALLHIKECQDLYAKYNQAFDRIFEMTAMRNYESKEYFFYRKYKDVFDEVYMSIDEYAKTPDAQQERNIITFQELYQIGKVKEGDLLSMRYDNVSYGAKLIYNEKQGQLCMALLDANGNAIPGYEDYRTPSKAAGDAVWLYRTAQGDYRGRPSLNGRDYWVLDRTNEKLSLLMGSW